MRQARKGLRIGLAAAGVVFLSAASPAVAGATPGTGTPGAGTPGTGTPGTGNPDAGRHCNVNASTNAERCFGSLGEAVSDARMSTARSANASDLIVGTFFVDAGYGGGSYTVYGESLCDGNDETDMQYDFPEEWKNTISAVQPWAKCWIWLYSEPDLGGDVDGPFKENTPDIGEAMGDRAQSVAFS